MTAIQLEQPAFCTGRNGTWTMTQLSIWAEDWNVYFRPVGQSGKKLNAGFRLKKSDIPAIIKTLEELK